VGHFSVQVTNFFMKRLLVILQLTWQSSLILMI